jgi:hypothetical protein
LFTSLRSEGRHGGRRLAIVKLLSVGYSKGGSFTMLSGRVMRDVVVDPATFEEFSRYMYDY